MCDDMKKTVVLIGPIAPPPWGPAAKNRILADTLSDFGLHVIEVNTLDWKRQPVKSLYALFRALAQSRRVILSVSRNGRFLLLPLLAFISIVKPTKFAFLPAGGRIGYEIEAMPLLLRKISLLCCRRCTAVALQRQEIEQHMRRLGLTNTVLLPNFKQSWSGTLPAREDSSRVRLLFLSRVRPLKGIEVLFQALDILTERDVPFALDILGIVKADYEAQFQQMLSSRPYASYGGVIDYDKVIPTIAKYDIMIFPTLEATEGFPGVLADAAMAGLPVIASDLSCTREIITDGFNGILAKPDNPADLAEKVEMLIKQSDLRREMGQNNRRISESYDAQNVLRAFIQELETKGW